MATPSPQEVKWKDGELIVPELGEEEKQTLAERIKLLDELLKVKQIGKYKIELVFHKARSVRNLTPGVICFWESGTKLHGGGDAKVYLCPGRSVGKNDCQAIIPDGGAQNGMLLCPKCSSIWPGEAGIGEVLYNLHMQQWAFVLARWFRKFEHNADIYVKFSLDDIRAKTAMALATQKGADALNKARADRGKHIYPMRNIIKDTSNGADLEGRMKAFLVA